MFRSAHDKPKEENRAPAKADDAQSRGQPQKKGKHRWRRFFAISGIVLFVLLLAARVAMPTVLKWYVNRTINQSPLYDGQISEIDVHLWRGAYTIKDIRLSKTTGNIPVPLFAAKRVD